MKSLYKAWLLAVTAMVSGMAAAEKVSSPNILYIFTDDQSCRTVSCYPEAYGYANTPNIDRLAKRGVLFTQAYIGAKCVPSRAGMLTGRFQYASRPDDQPGEQPGYWFSTLRKNGYYTGMIGKWHWGKGTEAHRHGTAWDWSVVWDHGQYEAAGGYYYDQFVNIDGGKPQKLGGYSTDRYTEFAVDFIKERQKEPAKPWFFWLCYGAVHGPYTPADRHMTLYLDQPETRTPKDVFGPRPGKPSHMQGSRWKKGASGEPVFQKRSLDSWAKQYTQAVAAIDESVGKIVETLEETGQLNNTIVVFTSDQGFAWGQHGLKDKLHPYAAAIKSPLIVSSPGRFPVGKVCKAPVNGPDIIRTFHALTDTEPDQELHGRDITPLLQQPESEAVVVEWNRAPTMMTYTYNRYTSKDLADSIKEKKWARLDFNTGMKKKQKDQNRPYPEATPVWFMITDGSYKYIRYAYPDRIEELYNVERDPEELVNLALDPKQQPRLADMRKDLVEELKSKGGAAFADILPPPKTL